MKAFLLAFLLLACVLTGCTSKETQQDTTSAADHYVHYNTTSKSVHLTAAALSQVQGNQFKYYKIVEIQINSTTTYEIQGPSDYSSSFSYWDVVAWFANSEHPAHVDDVFIVDPKDIDVEAHPSHRPEAAIDPTARVHYFLDDNATNHLTASKASQINTKTKKFWPVLYIGDAHKIPYKIGEPQYNVSGIGKFHVAARGSPDNANTVELIVFDNGNFSVKAAGQQIR